MKDLIIMGLKAALPAILFLLYIYFLLWVIVAANAGIYTWIIIVAAIAPFAVLAWWQTEEKPRREAMKVTAGWKPRPISEVLDEYEELLPARGDTQDEENEK